MQAPRQAISGILLAMASIVIILGGFLTAFTEGGMAAPPIFTPTVMTIIEVFPSPGGPTPPLPAPPSETTPASPVLIPTETLIPPVSCPPPAGWLPYAVYHGDTLAGLAQRFQTTSETLKQGNCLYSDSLMPGYILYVPPVSVPTATHCGPPPGWVRYTVQPGDNLYRIGLSYGISAAELQRANCLPSPDRIVAGSQIYVPNIPTLTPVLSPTLPVTVTPAIPTDTPLSIILIPTNTSVPTNTSAPTDTPTPTAPPTNIPPSPSPTSTP